MTFLVFSFTYETHIFFMAPGEDANSGMSL